MNLRLKIVSVKEVLEKETKTQYLLNEYLHLYRINQETSAHTDMLAHEMKNPMVLLACFSMFTMFSKASDVNGELASIIQQAEIETQVLQDAINSIYSNTQTISDQHYRIVNTDDKDKRELLIEAIERLKNENADIESQIEITLHNIKEQFKKVISSLQKTCEYFDIEYEKNNLEELHIPRQTHPMVKKLITKLSTGILGISHILFEKNVTISKVDIHEMVELAIEIQTKLATYKSNKEVSIIHNIRSNSVIYSDRTDLSQLLNNMIGNALKYNTSTTPQVSIHVQYLDYNNGDQYVKFAIKDNGIGLRKEDYKKVFEPNTRVEDAANQFKGSGIGLPVCKEIVESLGGQIWVESDGIGKGSTFYFTVEIPKSNKLSDREIWEGKSVAVYDYHIDDDISPNQHALIIDVDETLINTELGKLFPHAEEALKLANIIYDKNVFLWSVSSSYMTTFYGEINPSLIKKAIVGKSYFEKDGENRLCKNMHEITKDKSLVENKSIVLIDDAKGDKKYEALVVPNENHILNDRNITKSIIKAMIMQKGQAETKELVGQALEEYQFSLDFKRIVNYWLDN